VKIAIVGHGGVNTFGTGRDSYLIRTGRFTQAVPSLARKMQLVGVKNGVREQLKKIVTGRAVDVPEELREKNLTPAREIELYRKYIDLNKGIRVIRRGDCEQPEFDPQHFIQWVEAHALAGSVIDDRVRDQDEMIRRKKEVRLGACHAGIIPSGWDLMKETGLRPDDNPNDKVFKKMGRAQLMMVRALADALISTGALWEKIARKIPPEKRKVAAANGMAPGKLVYEGMNNFVMGRPIEQDLLGHYITDTMAFYLGKILGARHSSARPGACNTGICNIEDVVDRMRTGEFLLGAIATFESAINETSIEGFLAKKALASNRAVAELKDHPSSVSRPGLKNRYGFTIAEGGGVLLLMDDEIAKELELNVYGWLLSAKTAMGPQGDVDLAAPTEGVRIILRKGIEDAAKNADISPQKIVGRTTAIRGHGTSTRADTLAIHFYDQELRHFERDLRDPVIVSYDKGGPRIEGVPSASENAIGDGHPLGGAGTIAADEVMHIAEEGIVPPSVSELESVDPEILEARHVIYPTQPIRVDGDIFIVESDGFGDTHGLLVVEKNKEYDRDSKAAQWSREQFEEIEAGNLTPRDFIPDMTVEIRGEESDS
jgi:3-oxoacyl-(acyl-carrier-protein) synthase